MGTLKFGLEKPMFIWVIIAVVYCAAFFGGIKQAPLSEPEQASLQVIEQFAANTFPPKIALIREAPDWGHLGYYAVMGRFYLVFKSDPEKLRTVNLVLVLLSFLVFIRLGYRFTYRNRLNPLWISLALMVLAANPYSWFSAFKMGYLALLMLALELAMFSFESQFFGWAGVFGGAAILIDWRAGLLALAFVLFRMTGESSRLLRPERMLALMIPFVVGALPLLAWQGILPQGPVRDLWHQYRERFGIFHFDALTYMVGLLPIYGLIFSWSWAIRARARSLTIGAIAAAGCIPLFFLFPIRFDLLSELTTSAEVPLGLIDQGATAIAGQYKNLVLFVPWVAGVFLLAQLLLMDVLDRSRWLRYYIVLFFLLQPFVVGVNDGQMLMILPAVLLLSLSEAMVGEEGKLA